MHIVKNNPGFDGILIYMGYSFSLSTSGLDRVKPDFHQS